MNEETLENGDEFDEFDLESPAYIDVSSAIEVPDDNGRNPMEEDEDSDGVSEMQDEVMNDNDNIIEDCSSFKMEVHTDSIYSVVIDNDGFTVASGGGDDVAYIHNLNDKESSRLDFHHKDSVSCLSYQAKFSSSVSSSNLKNASLLAVGSYDGTIQLYDKIDNFKKIGSLEGPSDIEWLCWHPKGGTVLLCGSTDGTVWMFHVPSKKCMQVFVGHNQEVVAGSFTTDGKLALSAGTDGTVRLWAPKSGICRHSFPLTSSITCMDIFRDLALFGCENGTARLIHLKNKKILATLNHVDHTITNIVTVESVAFSTIDSFQWCATAASDGLLKIWDLSFEPPQFRLACSHHNDLNKKERIVITRMKWHPVLPIIVTAASDAIVRIWDSRSGQCLKTLTGHTDIINDMDICLMENNLDLRIVTGSDDCTVRVFDVCLASLASDPAISISLG